MVAWDIRKFLSQAIMSYNTLKPAEMNRDIELHTHTHTHISLHTTTSASVYVHIMYLHTRSPSNSTCQAAEAAVLWYV